MIRLLQSLNHWGSERFAATLRAEVEQLDINALPLQRALTHGSYVSDEGFQAQVLQSSADEGWIHARLGIFFNGIIAGCHCADDPTPNNLTNEYCQLQLEIDRNTAETAISLLAEE